MTAKQIKEYLGMLAGVEKEFYTQERMIANMEGKISRLGYRYNITCPQRTIVKVAPEETIFGVVITTIAFVIGLLWKLPIALTLVISGVVASPVVMEHLEANDRYNDELVKYQNAMNKYNAAVKQDKARVEVELRRKTFLQAELNSLKKTHEKTRAAREKLYRYNIIHPKYHGLIPVCSLYGYFDTGVCTQLEGHEGAYNKYDTESRLDYIICKMDEVLKHLEEIKNNQYQLYSAIQESNAQFNKLISNTNYMMGQLDGIQAQGAQLDARVASLQMTSALTLYETACNRQETAYLRRMAEWGY